MPPVVDMTEKILKVGEHHAVYHQLIWYLENALVT